jgi:energy-coupling factor transporter ATP-binding protein EcfA2
MGTLREVFEWSKGLPDWESDTFRRLFGNDALADQEVEDILALLKTAHGIPDPQGRTPVRLTADLIPVAPPEGRRTVLRNIKDIQHVNAIAPAQQLPFAPGGLTVIYGDNGSGKSGYVRVLKNACRARDGGGRILANAFAPAAERGTPRAIFEFETGDETRSAEWTYGTPCDDAMSAIAVFDSQCARAYLDDEHDVAYIPYGLSILRELAKTLGLLRTRLTKELERYATNAAEFSDLSGDTAVGRLIGGLSHTTSAESVNRLATLSTEERTRLDILARSLRESDPKRKAQAHRRLKTRIDHLKATIAGLTEVLSLDAISRVRGVDRAFLAAQEAARIAAESLSQGENLLPGTGGQVWKELFLAAKKFSETDAYSGQAFPVVSDGARCVLCQQPLAEGAARMSRFYAFIQQETERVMQDAQRAVRQTQDSIASLTPEATLSPENDALLTEIQDHQQSLPQSIRDYLGALTERKAHVLSALRGHQWTPTPLLPPDPVPGIRSLSARLNDEAAEMERVAAGEDLRRIEAEHRELDARKRLSTRKAAVLAAIQKLLMQNRLRDCVRATDTTAISLKSTELQQKRITAELTAALNREFEVLGARQLRVGLATRSERGKPLQKLKLDLPSPARGADEISQILSEGEQRILAIASFLAEASFSRDGSGLVFDDPVCSLDHKYRGFVAERLVTEAAKKQIIIFTHDIVFLYFLREACQRQGVPFFPQHLVAQGNRFGVVRQDLPFIATSSSSRIGHLRDLHQRANKLYRDGDMEQYERLVRDGYGLLRNSWERVVEEVLLNDVVQRFRPGVETKRLRDVVVDNSDVKTTYDAMSRCSPYEHDCARELQMPVPPPDEFLRDVEELAEYLSGIRRRAEAVRKARTSLFEAPKA